MPCMQYKHSLRYSSLPYGRLCRKHAENDRLIQAPRITLHPPYSQGALKTHYNKGIASHNSAIVLLSTPSRTPLSFFARDAVLARPARSRSACRARQHHSKLHRSAKQEHTDLCCGWSLCFRYHYLCFCSHLYQIFHHQASRMARLLVARCCIYHVLTTVQTYSR